MSNHDIIFFSECWSNRHSKLKLEGYERVCKHRKRRKRARRDSGGLVCFFKKNIWKGITCCTWSYEDGLLFKLDKIFFGFENDIYLICPYMRPSTSTRNVLETGNDSYEILTDKIAELSNLGDIIMMGDLNSRTGDLQDFYDFLGDNDEHGHMLDEECININVINKNDFYDNDMLLTRVSQDKGNNEFGKRLIALCKMCNLIILNGRTGEDKGVGKLTFCNHRGSSVNDYVLCTSNVLKNIDNFYVSNPNVFSDHSPICLKLNCKNVRYNISENSTSDYSFKRAWKEEKKQEFLNEINKSECINVLLSISSTLDSENINDIVINECVSQLQAIVNKAGSSHTVTNKMSSNDSRPTQNNSTQLNGWYDNECKELRLDFHLAEREYRNLGGEMERLKMCELRKKYRKCCRKKRTQFHRNRSDELVALSKSNPRLFWKKIKKTKNKFKANCNFYEYFKELNNLNPQLGVEEEEKISFWETNGNNNNVDHLDAEITITELENAIGKLKTNKSCGLDNILNEFIIFGGETLKLVLLKLFNRILETGCFPSVWACGEIVPVFKSGDPNIPSNYRGITLVSCIGKLFTNILNSRLNEWAEENDIYSESQYGFRQNRSTSDCLFVLHGLINNYTSNSKPLYCAFIDLKRAFDNTNRRALMFKLYENKVSSKLIKLIKNMYSQIKLTVKGYSRQLDEINRTTSSDSLEENLYCSNLSFDTFFCSKAGVFQGESLSPFLFSMFINDIDDCINTANDVGVPLETCLLSMILFADDMAVFSLTRVGLQNGLDCLYEYCARWGLTVNVEKTKCVAFKKGGKIACLDQWTFNGSVIETVNQFKYLGFVLGSSGTFNKGIDSILTKS